MWRPRLLLRVVADREAFGLVGVGVVVQEEAQRREVDVGAFVRN